MRKTLNNVLAEYGKIALVVYLAMFTLVLGGFWFAITLGWNPQGVAASVGTFTVAYLATKATQPLRILATLALTPVIASVYGRMGGRVAPPPPVEGD
jgi:hypothetical protein